MAEDTLSAEYTKDRQWDEGKRERRERRENIKPHLTRKLGLCPKRR
jgi:hypothetical protein